VVRSNDGGTDALATAQNAVRLVELGVTDVVVAPPGLDDPVVQGCAVGHEETAVAMKELVEAFWRIYSG
jgi:hypothetical protein